MPATSLVHDGAHWSVERFVSGFSNNAFLLICRETGNGIVIDTPDQPIELIAAAKKVGNVQAILITHGHHDHIEGLKAVTSAVSGPVLAGEADVAHITDYSGIKVHPLQKNASVTAGSITLHPIATLGHTNGSTCFLLYGKSADEAPILFSGDTLFPGGPGRTTSHSNFLQIVESIETKLLPLPDNTRVMPGHGDFTSIADVKKEFVEFKKRPLLGNESGNFRWIG